jgi:hypothetical protein
MKTLKFLVVLVMLMVFATPACAHHRGSNVDVRIVPDRGGQFTMIPFRSYFSGKTHVIKKYLEARKGENYSIVVRNRSSERIGIVVAVDGRNIISGRKSYLKNNEMMYIVGPYGSVKLEGWRTDDDTVHKFYFTDVHDSYSVRTFGDKSAMGVITLAVFHEKDRPAIFYDRSFREELDAPQAGALGKSDLKKHEGESAGTGFGEGRHSPVVRVEFEPERIPREKILVKYEWHDVLCKKGLIRCWQEEDNRLWDEYSFAPFPPEYCE